MRRRDRPAPRADAGAPPELVRVASLPTEESRRYDVYVAAGRAGEARALLDEVSRGRRPAAG